MRLLAFALVLTSPLIVSAASDKLVVHEWGTFSALQDESGRAISGINVNDEPLPKFIHRTGPGLVTDDNGGKGISLAHPDVTMRLETPVIYFYPPANQDKIPSVDVSATFNGGLLTEFYPAADVTIDGKVTKETPSRITESLHGGLAWRNVVLGANVPMPETNSHVWVSPRKVDSTPISVGKEAEQYIFYRGCGHIDAPLKAIRSGDSKSLSIMSNVMESVAPIWLAEFRRDGTCAFRNVNAINPASCAFGVPASATFADKDFSADNLEALRQSMHEALVAAGLFPKEANAMLETWKLSYFKSVGQRLFFIVPRTWTDQVLPLTISKPCELTRVMIGRIELITPSQREAINHIVAESKLKNHADLTASFALLGRFGSAMVTDAAQRHPFVQVLQSNSTH